MPIPASGFAPGEHDGLCMLGELTDLGRFTGFKLGEKLRSLYVDQLNFLPPMFTDHSDFYLRSSHVARSNETLLSLFQALYPPNFRAAGLKPVIYTRLFPQENAYPNDENCKRLSELGFMFSEIVAQKWNPVLSGYPSQMLNDVLPNGVAIDGSPRASGIFDTVSACVAHDIALPEGFNDQKVMDTLKESVIDEWYLGVKSSKEYRKLAVGALAGDFLHRLRLAVTKDEQRHGSPTTIKGLLKGKSTPKEEAVKFALYGSHDTTIASLLCALDAYDDSWPPFTSDLTFELFADAQKGPSNIATSASSSSATSKRDYYVRLTYNDKIVHLPACSTPGTNLSGDKSFCTLAAFEAALSQFIPQNWELACRSNLGKSILDAPKMAEAFKKTPKAEGVVMQKQQA